jgi:transposase, IS30 family
MSKYHQLTQDERYSITAQLRSGHSQADIARALGRSPSTISRELSRNVTHHDGKYRAAKAQQYSTARRRRCRRGPHFSTAQWEHVVSLIQKKWSPEQVADHICSLGEWSISHETIYRHILKDKATGGTLFRHLRIMPKNRRKRYNTKDSRGILAGKRHISERPPEVSSRQQQGHWEGDTVIGKDKHHCVLTLVERSSGYAIIKKLHARTAAAVVAAASKAIREQGAARFRTITFDNGTEFHSYKVLEDRFPVVCYFATPYHSWERGTNENFNGLFRQYVPKGTCMKSLTQSQCDIIVDELNSRPRKRYAFKTPQDIYNRS